VLKDPQTDFTFYLLCDDNELVGGVVLTYRAYLVFGRTKKKSRTLYNIMTGDTNWYYPCVVIGLAFIDEGLLQNELRH
jgi:hypothetical protein